MSKVILKQDLIIPAGTEFNNCDGLKVEFASDNFEAIIGTGKDGVVSIYINGDVVSDDIDKFEIIK